MTTFTLLLILGNMMTTVPNFQTLENCEREGHKFVAIATRAFKERPLFTCFQQDYVIDDVEGPK